MSEIVDTTGLEKFSKQNLCLSFEGAFAKLMIGCDENTINLLSRLVGKYINIKGDCPIYLNVTGLNIISLLNIDLGNNNYAYLKFYENKGGQMVEIIENLKDVLSSHNITEKDILKSIYNMPANLDDIGYDINKTIRDMKKTIAKDLSSLL